MVWRVSVFDKFFVDVNFIVPFWLKRRRSFLELYGIIVDFSPYLFDPTASDEVSNRDRDILTEEELKEMLLPLKIDRRLGPYFCNAQNV